LVGIDFSDESRKAVQYAGAFARQFGAAVTLLHVAEPLVCSGDYGYGPITNRVPNLALLRRARARLNLLAKRLAGCASKLATVVRTGVAAVEIPQAARDLNADLILIGTRGGSLEQTTAAGTAERVVRHAPCPVLVVRKKEHEFVCPGKLR
jgi:nucleotide-binding universal stress UspA family protein